MLRLGIKNLQITGMSFNEHGMRRTRFYYLRILDDGGDSFN